MIYPFFEKTSFKTMSHKDENYLRSLEELQNEQQYRTLTPILPLDETHSLLKEKKVLNFSSHDYLGLSFHPALQKSAIKYILQYGSSSTTAPSSNTILSCQTALEEKLANALGTESALLLPSRFQTNTSVLATLSPTNSILFMDSRCHDSLKYGMKCSSATIEGFSHHDLTHLRTLLEKTENLSYFSKVIATESIFSSEGDFANLNELIALANEFNALLYVDDTHAFGTMGSNGMGLAAKKEGIDIIVGSFYHGGGSSLSYVGCSDNIKEYLINFCPALKENPLPLSALGAIDASLDLIPELEGERKQLEQRAYFLRKQLHERGFSTGSSTSHLVPLFLESNERTQDIQQTLLECGIFTEALLSPQVPQGTSRLLFSLSAYHTPDHLNELLEALKLEENAALCTAE